PDLPQEIAAEARKAAASLDEFLHRLAHVPGPVFVMADGYETGIVVEDFGAVVQVGLGDDVEIVAFALGPNGEMPVELRPPRSRVILPPAAGIAPFLGWKTRSVVHVRKRRNGDAGRSLGQPYHASGPRPLEREDRRPLVLVRPPRAEIMVGAAPVVVGRPRARREH